VETSVVPGLSSDGYIEPLGASFADGLRMVLRAGAAPTRSRFTIAHELCHTFFYEIVPELKYGVTGTDPEEERLCNLGASELLIPAKSLRSCAQKYLISLSSLEELAAKYVVSPEAMLLRLRTLQLWHCELSYWRPKLNGFSLDRIVGGRRVQWAWRDDSALQEAWNTKQGVTGRTYVELREPDGGLKLRFVCFEVVRRGSMLVMLWGAKPFEQKVRVLPLFEKRS
jgi:hypothetical protein